MGGPHPWHVPGIGASEANVGQRLERTGLRSQKVLLAMVSHVAAHKGVSVKTVMSDSLKKKKKNSLVGGKPRMHKQNGGSDKGDGRGDGEKYINSR